MSFAKIFIQLLISKISYIISNEFLVYTLLGLLIKNINYFRHDIVAIYVHRMPLDANKPTNI